METAKAPLVRAAEQTSKAASDVQGALGAYSGTFEKAAADHSWATCFRFCLPRTMTSEPLAAASE